MADYPHVMAGLQYAADIVDGKIPACKYAIQACKRQLDDLDRGNFDYKFDLDKAERICRFIELFPHVKGTWARKKENISLSPFQNFALTTIFGWINKETGSRRFQEVYFQLPRKNGKSVTAAAVGLYMLAADGEHGAEVYCGATSSAQAWEVFRPARLMALAVPKFMERFGIEVRKDSIVLRGSSRFAPLIGKPGDGSSPSCALIDEYHEHDTTDQYDTMATGMIARDQPLLFIITTAGKDISGPCYTKLDQAIKVLNGTVKNDAFFAMVYTIDNPDDWNNPESLRIANPNFGISINAEKLEHMQNEAIHNIEKQVAFKTKHLNLWVQSGNPWIDAEKWKSLEYKKTPEDFGYDGVIFSLDLASKQDLVCFGKLFFKVIDKDIICYWVPIFYLPSGAVNRDVTGKYNRWVKQGYIRIIDGEEIRQEVIKNDILQESIKYRCNELAYDPWYAQRLSEEFEDEGMECVEIPATAKNFSPAMFEIESSVASKRIMHDGNECMRWMVSNVVVKKDRNDNIFPRKERPEMKIDGPVALIMAMNRAMAIAGAQVKYAGELMVV